MSASFLPSLKHTTLTKAAVEICNCKEVRRCINLLDFKWDKFAGPNRWKEVLEKAEMKATELNLPPQLHRCVVALIKPIALEIARWKSDHVTVLGTKFNYISCPLYWKAEGIIDRQTTARKLFLSENLCISDRFSLACYYCYEDEVERTWNNMCPKEKKLIYDGNFTFNVRVWLSWMEKKGAFNWSQLVHEVLNQLYPNTVCNYQMNRIWLRCFFDKLTPEEKNQCIAYTVNNAFKDHDNFRFCISQLDENQRELVFRKNPARLLRFFLDWPYQSLFSGASEQMWKYLQETDFRSLVYFIIFNRIVAEFYDFDYVNLLKDFWRQSPKHFKEYIKKDSLFEPVKMVIYHNFPQQFPKEKIIQSFSYVEPETNKVLLQREGDLCQSF